MSNELLEKSETEYFGCRVEVWRVEGGGWHRFPWRFAVTHGGKRREFSGVPNYCRNRQVALKRAWYRAKWLADGSYSDRYGPE